jgi:hypothetical protein
MLLLAIAPTLSKRMPLTFLPSKEGCYLPSGEFAIRLDLGSSANGSGWTMVASVQQQVQGSGGDYGVRGC